ncbi:hypothetical protein IWZ00DRAFT_491835 [Phyllosticta capitalensis]
MAAISEQRVDATPAISRLPAEIVDGIAAHLDKSSLLSLSLTSRIISNQVEHNLKSRFAKMQYGLARSELRILDSFGRTRFANWVKHLVFLKPRLICHVATRQATGPDGSLEPWYLYYGRHPDRMPEEANLDDYLIRLFILHLPALIASFRNLETVTVQALSCWDGHCPDLYDYISKLMQSTTAPLGFQERLFPTTRSPLRLRLDSPDYLCEILWYGPTETAQMSVDRHPPEKPGKLPGHEWSNNFQWRRFPGFQRPLFKHSRRPLTLRVHCVKITVGRILPVVALCSASAPAGAETLTLYNLEEVSKSSGNEDREASAGPWVVYGQASLWRITSKPQNLSIVRCRILRFLDEDFLKSFFDKLRLRCDTLRRLRFEKVSGVFFDWDDDGNLDDGRRLPQIIDEFGMHEALSKMINACRIRKDLETVNLFEECHCTEALKWSSGFDHDC